MMSKSKTNETTPDLIEAPIKLVSCLSCRGSGKGIGMGGAAIDCRACKGIGKVEATSLPKEEPKKFETKNAPPPRRGKSQANSVTQTVHNALPRGVGTVRSGLFNPNVGFAPGTEKR